ncbi:MAG: AMP-binding protein, partial [Gammaproteobacteria bacterium]|nr:AMP-binding protein [Gammaproteobacteria bacterium]
MHTVRDWIERHATERPDAPFLIAPESRRTLTFGELRTRVDEIGARLDSLQASPGGKVAFMLNNGLWTTLLFLGVMASRRVIVPLNAVAGLNQLEYVLDHSDSDVLFISPQYREQLAAVLERFPRPITVVETTEDDGPASLTTEEPSGMVQSLHSPQAADPALLLYTSGTTGRPKGAVLSHRAVIAGGCNVVQGHGLTADDRALCVLPIYHINGAMVTLSAPLVSGGSVVMPHRFSAQRFWEWVADHRCSWSSVVPTIIKYLLDRAEDEPFTFGDDERLAQFRFGRSASAALPAVVLEQWEDTFHVPMIETLGLTETAG